MQSGSSPRALQDKAPSDSPRLDTPESTPNSALLLARANPANNGLSDVIDLLMADDRQDLILEGVDVAFRFGPLQDSNATSRILGRSPRLLVASPDYLVNASKLVEPGDLAAHTFVIGPSGTGADGWTFEKDGCHVVFRGEGRLTVSVNEGATAAAVAGLGILTTGSWGCRSELSDGRLVQVLPDWKLEPVEVNAVFPAGRAARAAARALVAYLVDELRPISA